MRRDWTQIKREYIETDITLRELAQKYNIHPSTIFSRSAKEKWSEEKEIFRSKLEAKRIERRTDLLAAQSASFDASCYRISEIAVDILERKILEMRKKDLDKEGLRILERLADTLRTFQTIGKAALGEDPEEKKAHAMFSWTDIIKLGDT